MNRASRRKAGIVSQKREFTDAQLKAFIDKGVELELERTRNMIFERYLYVTCLSLHDEFNFGRKRLETMMQKIQLTLACIRDGDTSVEAIRKWLDKKYGMQLFIKYGKDVNNATDQIRTTDDGKRGTE